MSNSQRIVRIFISSPGDVAEERENARRVIEGLQKRYPDVSLQSVLWEDLALPATASFQETIELILHQRPIDIAVFILWSRLGSPLTNRVLRPDGTEYRSGTEREFDLMLKAFEQSGKQRPVMLAYVRDDVDGFEKSLSEDKAEEMIAQRKLAKSFIREQFHDADGRNLRAYQTYREPVDFVGRLRAHLQQSLDDLLGMEATPRWHEEPYRGLEVFDVRHADIFRGRDEETCDLMQRLRDQRRAGCAFAVIVGASGAGKSSLARAGVAASLLQHSGEDGVKAWRTEFFVPALGTSDLLTRLTRSLFDALPELRSSATALEDVTSLFIQDAALAVRLSIAPAFSRAAEQSQGVVRLLLMIDQMEELWTDRRITKEDRELFLAVIEALACSGHVVVLATLRSDFYPHAQQLPAFLRLKGERGHFDLLPPNAAALQRLITEPARLAGVRFERHEKSSRSLDELILQDAAKDPSALPLLQYALSELYQNRDDGNRLLTFAAYQAMGGVEGALGKRAEEVFQDSKLSDDARAALGEILPLLITIDIAGEQAAVRLRAPLTKLTATPPRAALTNALITARFLTSDRQGDEAIASLAHEALLRCWKRIETWITSNREHLRLRARVEQSQHRWASQGQHTSLLLPSGLPLEEGQVLLREARPLLLAETTDYIEHSVSHRQSESRRQRLIRTTALTMSLTAALIAILAALWINTERNAALDAKNAETTAKTEESKAKTSALADAQKARDALRIARVAEQREKVAKDQAEVAKNQAVDALRREKALKVEAEDAREREEELKIRAEVALREKEGAMIRVLAAKQTAEKQQAAALRENANHYWRLAVNIRDSKDPDPIRASHLFLLGAKSLAQIVKNQSTKADEAFRSSVAHVASVVDRSCVQTWAHDGSVRGCTYSRDESHMLTWSEDKTARFWDVTNRVPLKIFKHDGTVYGAQFSRDESRVLTWSEDGSARLWDVTKPEPLQIFKHNSALNGAQFSRDESRVLTWSSDKTARLWDVTKPEPVQIFKHDEVVVDAVLSSDESRLLSRTHNGAAWLWEVTKSEPIRILKHDNVLIGAQFSRDQSRVLTWGGSVTIKGEAILWDVNNLEPLHVFKHDDIVIGAQFYRDESRVLTWSVDKVAKLWDVSNPQPRMAFKHEGRIRGVQFNRDESRILTWSSDVNSPKDVVQVWDVTWLEPLQTFKHDGFVEGARFSRDGARVLTWSFDGVARLWDMTNPEPLHAFKHNAAVIGASFSHDESRVLTWSRDGAARLWEVSKPKELRILEHTDIVRGVQLSRDESRVLTWSEDNTACLWDVTKSEPIQTYKHDSPVNGAIFSRDESRVMTWSTNTARLWDVGASSPFQMVHHSNDVMGARFGRDNSRVLTWSQDGTARISDVTKPERRQIFKHDGVVIGAQFSRDESRVLTWSWDNTAKLWDVTKPLPIQTFEHTDNIRGAQFSRDESRVLTWSIDKTARLWDVTKSEPIQIFRHESPVNGAQFSHDESRLLTWSGLYGDKNGEAQLWDVSNPEPLQIFKHNSEVNGAQFSHDESRLLTWSRDKTARLWDVSNPEPLQIFKHNSEVSGVQFSRDESRLLTWSSDKTARLWDVTKPEPIHSFNHDANVRGAQFSRDDSRVLTWGGKTVRLWDALDPLSKLNPAERILELEVRSAMVLDANLKLRTLSFAEWQAKVQSPEYRAIEQKLAARPQAPGLTKPNVALQNSPHQ